MALLPESLNLPLFAFFTPLLMCHSVAAYAEFRRAVVGGVALVAPLWTGWLLDRLHHGTETAPDLAPAEVKKSLADQIRAPRPVK